MDAAKRQRWDRQIFYVFCALMRIRNLKYFDWWTVINTAAYIGKPLTNITSFFGITMLQLIRRIMRKSFVAWWRLFMEQSKKRPYTW